MRPAITTAFPFASENMLYDDVLLRLCENGHFDEIQRIYRWNQPGLTIPKGRKLPESLKLCDTGVRSTGGGIVFHNPGDIVFCIISKKTTKLKQKMSETAQKIQSSLANLGIRTQMSQSPAGWQEHDRRGGRSRALTGPGPLVPQSKNLTYCAAYFNPYELHKGKEKVLGLSLRKTRHHVMIQGVLHVASHFDHFQQIPKFYQQFFSRGLGTVPPNFFPEILSQFSR